MPRGNFQRLLDESAIEAFVYDDAELLEFWTDALDALRDASLAGMSEKGRLGRAYDGGRLAATAVLGVAGYRVHTSRGGGHHYLTFQALYDLDEPDVSRFGDRLERARRPRAQAQYGRRAIGTPPQPMTAADVTALLADFLTVAHGWLARQRPSISWPNPPAAPPAPSASQP